MPGRLERNTSFRRWKVDVIYSEGRAAAWPVVMEFIHKQAWKWERYSPGGLAISTSVLAVLATPGLHLASVAWVAFVPLLLALRSLSVLSSFGLAWGAGFAAYAGIAYWVVVSPVFTNLESMLIPGYLGLHWGLFGAALAFARTRAPVPLAVAAPIIWVACEFIRSELFPIELPWTLLGHSQYQSVALIQVAAVTGVYGVSCLIVLVNSLIVESIVGLRQPVRVGAAIVLVLGVVVVSGRIVLASADPAPSIPVTVVPGNVAQDVKWDPVHQEDNFRRYMDGSLQAVRASRTALVIWPETSVPGPLNRDLKTLEALQRFVRQSNSALLIGSGEREKFAEGGSENARRYNSAFLFTPSSDRAGVYHKMQLLPFGEYLPFEKYLSWPERYRSHTSRFAAGEDYAPLSLRIDGKTVPFGVLICWEGIFPNLVRGFVLRGATFLIGISNEAWFDGASAAQFLAMNTFRAVENRRALVRSVNGGSSGFIDPYGHLVSAITPDQGNPPSGGFLTHEIPIVERRTFYTSFGDVFAEAMLAASCVFLIVSLWRQRVVEERTTSGDSSTDGVVAGKAPGLPSPVGGQREVLRT